MKNTLENSKVLPEHFYTGHLSEQNGSLYCISYSYALVVYFIYFIALSPKEYKGAHVIKKKVVMGGQN